DAGSLLHDDQRLGAELLERDGAAGEGMSRRAGEDDLVAEERLEHDSALAPGGADDPELELSPADEVDDRLRVVDREADRRRRIRRLELAEERREDRAARPRRGADLEPPGERALGAGGHLVHELPLEREQLLRAAVEGEPGLGRLHPPAGAVEEALPEPLLERTNLEAHRRLRDAEPLRRLREALPLDDGAEGRE